MLDRAAVERVAERLRQTGFHSASRFEVDAVCAQFSAEDQELISVDWSTGPNPIMLMVPRGEREARAGREQQRKHKKR
jgi:hypothetical protein